MSPEERIAESKAAVAKQRALQSIRKEDKKFVKKKKKPKGMGRPATGPMGWKLDYPPGVWGRSNEEKRSNWTKDA